MKKSALFFVAAMIASGLAHAGAITVTYQNTTPPYNAPPINITGTFSGNDLNSDGWLTYNELDQWSVDYSPTATLADLNDIGDFNYLTNSWMPNALQWDQATPDAYLTWFNWSHSVSTSNFNWVMVTSVESIPEPGSLALLGLGFGLLGFGAMRRRAAA